MTDAPVYPQQELADGSTPFNSLMFVIKRAMAGVNVATLVQVQAVYNTGTGPVGTVDVLPVVNQVTGADQTVPHTTIYGLPYFRYQGGANAVIVDPVIGDFGFCVFADRDIGSAQAGIADGNAAMTAVPSSGAPPSSARRFDYADGLYIGGWNGNLAPTNYVQITGAVIQMVLGGTSAVLTSDLLTVNANLKVNGTAEVTGNVTCDAQAEVKGLLLADASIQVSGTVSGAGGSGGLTVSVPITANSSITAAGEVKSGTHTLTSHTHTGVTPGGGSTGGPVG
jgi:hypothetical protein